MKLRRNCSKSKSEISLISSTNKKCKFCRYFDISLGISTFLIAWIDVNRTYFEVFQRLNSETIISCTRFKNQAIKEIGHYQKYSEKTPLHMKNETCSTQVKANSQLGIEFVSPKIFYYLLRILLGQCGRGIVWPYRSTETW